MFATTVSGMSFALVSGMDAERLLDRLWIRLRMSIEVYWAESEIDYKNTTFISAGR